MTMDVWNRRLGAVTLTLLQGVGSPVLSMLLLLEPDVIIGLLQTAVQLVRTFIFAATALAWLWQRLGAAAGFKAAPGGGL